MKDDISPTTEKDNRGLNKTRLEAFCDGVFAIAITLIYRKLLRGPVHYLNLVPFMVMIFDFLENFAIISLLSHYPEQSFFMAVLCEIFKLLKWLFFALTLFLTLYGLVKLLFRK